MKIMARFRFHPSISKFFNQSDARRQAFISIIAKTTVAPETSTTEAGNRIEFSIVRQWKSCVLLYKFYMKILSQQVSDRRASLIWEKLYAGGKSTRDFRKKIKTPNRLDRLSFTKLVNPVHDVIGDFMGDWFWKGVMIACWNSRFVRTKSIFFDYPNRSFFHFCYLNCLCFRIKTRFDRSNPNARNKCR